MITAPKRVHSAPAAKAITQTESFSARPTTTAIIESITPEIHGSNARNVSIHRIRGYIKPRLAANRASMPRPAIHQNPMHIRGQFSARHRSRSMPFGVQSILVGPHIAYGKFTKPPGKFSTFAISNRLCLTCAACLSSRGRRKSSRSSADKGCCFSYLSRSCSCSGDALNLNTLGCPRYSSIEAPISVTKSLRSGHKTTAQTKS